MAAFRGIKIPISHGMEGVSVIKVRQVFNRANIVDTDASPWLSLSQMSYAAEQGTAFDYKSVSFRQTAEKTGPPVT